MTPPRRSLAPLALAVWLAACGPTGSPEPRPGRAELLEVTDRELLVPRPALLPYRAVDRLPPEIDPRVLPRVEYDPVSYWRLIPNRQMRVPWFEHRGRSYDFATNSLGLRERDEVRLEAPDLRVLCTGDSHAEGVVDDAESFANVLEARLRAAAPERSVEVLNASVGFYTFPNYLGVLVKLLPLEPDVFVVCVFGGNDFGSLVGMHASLQGLPAPTPPPGYFASILRAQEVRVGPLSGTGSVWQGYNQLAFFAAHPEFEARAADWALEYAAEIERLCGERGVRCLWIYLPPAEDVEPEPFAALNEAVARELGLDADARLATRRVAARFLAGLRARGAEVVDATEPLRAEGAPVYWRQDQHLNVAGHAVLARLLEAQLAR